MRISPAVRLALGLVVLMLSILFSAQMLHLVPDVEQQHLSVRKSTAENLAFQVLLAMSRTDNLLMQKMLDSAVAQNPELQSAGVRFTSGGYMHATDGHGEKWSSLEQAVGSPDIVQIPLSLNGANKGFLEVVFVPLTEKNQSYWGFSRNLLLLVFLCISAFVGFWLLIRKTLNYLDPSAVVPGRVRNAMNVLAEGVLIMDKREQIVLANSAISSKLQLDEKRLLGRKASALGWQRMMGETAYPWQKTLAGGEKQVGARVAFTQEDGTVKTFQVNTVPILDDKGNSQGAIASFDDVSELEATNGKLQQLVAKLSSIQVEIEEKNRKLEHLASRDPLTDCFNRRVMREKLDAEFAAAKKTGADLVCIMLDIDHFKKVNDTYGHAMGDAVIKMVAAIVKASIREGDIVARFGGEEFCVLFPEANVEQVQKIAERCRRSIESQQCEGVKVTSSFGISALTLGASDPNELVQQADEALYKSKQNGRNRVSLWGANLAQVAQR